MSHCGRTRNVQGPAELTTYIIGMVVPSHQTKLITIQMRPSIRRRATSLRSLSDLTRSSFDADGSVAGIFSACPIMPSGSAGRPLGLLVQFFGNIRRSTARRRVRCATAILAAFNIPLPRIETLAVRMRKDGTIIQQSRVLTPAYTLLHPNVAAL
jgi:hypothetical protein